MKYTYLLQVAQKGLLGYISGGFTFVLFEQRLCKNPWFLKRFLLALTELLNYVFPLIWAEFKNLWTITQESPWPLQYAEHVDFTKFVNKPTIRWLHADSAYLVNNWTLKVI